MTPEQHQQTDYAEITVEVGSFYQRLRAARQSCDGTAEMEAQRKMNACLDELGDVIKAIGSTGLSEPGNATQ